MKNLIVLGNDLCRRSDCTTVRPFYEYTYSRITNSLQLRATIRNGQYAWPGGYPLYLICADSEALCFDCAKTEYKSLARGMRDHDKQWTVLGCEINYEDNDLFCAHCNQQIESAYGEES